MEGLLPMVYKAIKRNRTRQKYECLSSGAAQSHTSISEEYYVEPGPTYMMNMNMNLNSNTNTNMLMRSTSSYSTQSMPQTQKTKDHRRHKSLGEYAFGMSTPEILNTTRHDDDDDFGNKKAKLVRFRSHRFRMFSCVGGC